MAKACKGGYQLEVTVERLVGIELVNGTDGAHHCTATVGFSGSLQNMEVFSSTLCAETGRQLLVESEPLTVKDGCLEARWAVGQEEERAQPHLRVQLQARDVKIITKLAQTNRGSLVRKRSDLDQFETSSTCTNSSVSGAVPLGRGSSAVWSNAGGAVLPEIVELSVRLKSEDYSEQTGIAHLVVFGTEQDRGMFVMELPVKRPATWTPSGSSCVALSRHAKLRVLVKVTPPPSKQFVRSLSTATTSTASSETVSLTRSEIGAKVAPLLKKIEENELEALEFAKKQKRAMQVEVPVYEDIDPPQQPYFCTAFSWQTILQTLHCAVLCDTGNANAGRSDQSTGSTIATRDSLDL
jgi:hypothetical protein